METQSQSACKVLISRQHSTWRRRSPVLERFFSLPGSCDFNLAEEQWEESCQLAQNSGDDFDWRMSQRSAPPPLGPYVDHSPGQFSLWFLINSSPDLELTDCTHVVRVFKGGDGKFLYIDSAPQRDGDIAKVTTKSPFPASMGLCHLRFWFYMQGSDRMGTLKVLQSDSINNSKSSLLLL